MGKKETKPLAPHLWIHRTSLLGLALVMFFAVGGVLAADSDGDGWDDSIDPYTQLAVTAPVFEAPVEGSYVINPTRTVDFSGTAEVGTDVVITPDEGGATLCSDTVIGNGSALNDGSTLTIDGTDILNSSTSVVVRYDTTQDAAANTWRLASSASWYLEEKHDTVDGICDYQTSDGDGDPRSGADDRCGEEEFPARVLVAATGSKVVIFDADTHTFWRSQSAVGAVTKIAAAEGKFFIGTSSGIEVWDFAADDFSVTYTTVTSPSLISNTIQALSIGAAGGDDYLVVATDSGITAVNITDGTSVSTAVAGDISDVTIDSLSRVRAINSSNAVIRSDASLDLVTSGWTSTDITATLPLNFVSFTANALSGDLVGTTEGVVWIEDAGGELLVQKMESDHSTLPLSGDVRGHWSDFLGDETPNGHTLTDNNTVGFTSVETGAEQEQASFDGSTNYLSVDHSDFNITSDELTVGVWVKRPDLGGFGSYRKIVTHGEAGGESTLFADRANYWISAGESFFPYGLESDPYYFGVRTDSTEKAVAVDPAAMLTDTWQFVVGTYDGSNLRMYVDGVQQSAAVPLTGNIANLEEELRLGWGYDSEYFNGDIALPFVAAEAYSPTQIAAMYSATQGWFNADAANTLFGSSDDVQEISCDAARQTCLATTSTTITRISDVRTTEQVATGTGLIGAVDTYFSDWSCWYMYPSSQIDDVVRATSYLGAVASNVFSQLTFSVFTPTEDYDMDGLENGVDVDPFIPITRPTITDPVDATTVYESDITFQGSREDDGGTITGTIVKVFEGDPSVCIGAGNCTELCEDAMSGDGSWSCGPVAMTQSMHQVFAHSFVNVASVDYASDIYSTDLIFEVDTIAPTEPTLTGMPTYTGSTDVTVTWAALDAEATHYEIEISTDAGFPEDARTSTTGWLSLPATEHTFSNRINGETYYVRMKLSDVRTGSPDETHGNTSAWSISVSTTIDTDAPITGTVDPVPVFTNNPTIPFSWTGFSDAAAGVAEYKYEVDEYLGGSLQDTGTGSVMAPTTNTTIVGTHGMTYAFRVHALDAAQPANVSTWAEATNIIVDTGAPTAPILNPLGTDGLSGSLTQNLVWSASSDDISGVKEYEVFRKKVDLTDTMIEDFTSIGVITSPTAQLQDTVEYFFVYTYRVVSRDNAGNVSANSNEVTVQIDEIPTPPEWAAGQSSYTNTGDVSLDWEAATDPNGGTVVSYNVYRNGIEIQTVMAPTTEYDDQSIKFDGETYEYTVRAVDNGSNEGDPSPVLHVLVDASAPITDVSATGTPGQNMWFISPVTVTLSADDQNVFDGDTNPTGFMNPQLFDPASTTGNLNEFYAGVEIIQYNDGGGETAYPEGGLSYGASTTAGSPVTVVYYTTDRADNTESPQQVEINIDLSDPTSQLVINSVLFNGEFTKENALDYRPIGADLESGVANVSTLVRFDENGDFSTNEASNFPFTEISTTNDTDQTYVYPQDGLYEFKVVTTDASGRATESTVVSVKVDRTAPVTAHDTPSGDQTQVFQIHLNATDLPLGVASGVTDVFYSLIDPLDGGFGGWTAGVAPAIDVTEEGAFDLWFYATDQLVNDEVVQHVNAFLDTNGDRDDDGLLNIFENTHGTCGVGTDGFGNAFVDGVDESGLDFDGDTLTNLEEQAAGSNPCLIDTDSDTIPDDEEVAEGTDPSDGTDHHFLLRAPQINATDSKFTLLGSATPNVEVTLTDGITTIVVPTDNNGNVFIETTLADAVYTMTASFDHPTAGTLVTPGITFTVTTGAPNPVVTNMSDGDRVRLVAILLDIEAAPNAQLELFQIVNGELDSLETGTADVNGDAQISVSLHQYADALFVLDTTNDLTSETITFLGYVQLDGQVLDIDTNAPVQLGSVKWECNDGRVYETTTDENGNYAMPAPVQTQCVAKYWQLGYFMQEFDIGVTTEDVRVSPKLEMIKKAGTGENASNLIQTETGVVTIASSGEAKTISWRGMARGEFKVAMDGPTMTYAESMAQVRKLNAGIGGYAKTYTAGDGTSKFAGYLAGRIGVDQFGVNADANQAFGFTAFNNHRGMLYASAEQEQCIRAHDSIANFIDVRPSSRYYDVILKAASTGLMKSDSNHAFQPDETLGWDTLLRSAMAADCWQPEEVLLLRAMDLPTLKNAPLSNDSDSRTYYTALMLEFINENFDPSKPPTRSDAMYLLLDGFEVLVDEEANNTSFIDIRRTDKLAAELVAAKQAGMFTYVDSQRFRPTVPITREEFAQWLVGMWEHQQEQEQLLGDDYERIQGRDDGPKGGQMRDTAYMKSVTDLEIVQKKQAVNAIKNARLVEQFEKMKLDDWNPLTNSGRARMAGIVDKSWNIRNWWETDEAFEARRAGQMVIKQKEIEERAASLSALAIQSRMRRNAVYSPTRGDWNPVSESGREAIKIKVVDPERLWMKSRESREAFRERLEALTNNGQESAMTDSQNTPQ